MGLYLFSRDSYSKTNDISTPKEVIRYVEVPKILKGNPNPRNYKITRSQTVGKYLLIEINYPDCKNYEGNKILLYCGTTLEKLINQKEIDPHFSDNNKFISPVARFEPTKRGWNMALQFIELLK